MDPRAKRLAEQLRRLGDVRPGRGGGGRPRGYAFAGHGGNASGITELLRRCYYPDYRYRGGATGEKGKGPRGMRRGTKVDVEVRGVVRALAAGETWKPGRDTHPLTTKFVRALDVLGLEPVTAQTCVGDPGEGLATGVDLVAMDRKTGRLVLVELKCGFNGYNDRGTGPMRHELAGFMNSPRFQHQLQLAVTLELFVRTFGLAPQTAYVLCANDNGVAYHELEPAVKALAPAMVARLRARRAAGPDPAPRRGRRTM